MLDATETVLWLACGAVSVGLLSWAILNLVRILRGTHEEQAPRRWFLVFLASMVALALAGAAAPAFGDVSFTVAGAAFALGGAALYRSVLEQRQRLEAQDAA